MPYRMFGYVYTGPGATISTGGSRRIICPNAGLGAHIATSTTIQQARRRGAIRHMQVDLPAGMATNRSGDTP